MWEDAKKQFTIIFFSFIKCNVYIIDKYILI